jgi:dienelactone hydrolase
VNAHGFALYSPVQEKGGTIRCTHVDLASNSPALCIEELALRFAGGVQHEVVMYDGAPHGFFNRKQEEFQDASAWNRVLDFIAGQAV